MSHQPISGIGIEEEEVAVDPVQLRRATLASSVGSALEYYDFYIYGLASALIFGQLFFTPLGPAGATIAAFGTYAVGFAARPIGGLIFGAIAGVAGVAEAILVGGVAVTLIAVVALGVAWRWNLLADAQPMLGEAVTAEPG